MPRARDVCWAVPLALAIAGCQESGSGKSVPLASVSAPLAPAATAPSASASATPQKPRRRFAPHFGLAAEFVEGAHALPDLKLEQREAMEKLEATTFADDEAVHDAMATFRADLAAGLRAGNVDTPKLKADDVVCDKVIADARSDEAEGLDFLHELLSDAQTKVLVSGLGAIQAARDARVADWLQAKEADGGAADWTTRRIGKLTADLALDAAQQKKVAALLATAEGLPSLDALQARWEERKKRVDALLAAFLAESFDAKKLDLGGVLPGSTPHEPLDRIVTFYVKIAALLHADQRDKLAQDLGRPFGGPRDGVPVPSVHRPGDDIAFPFVEPEEVRRGP